MKKTFKNTLTAGFTLMEIMVVIILLSVLAGLAMPRFLKTLEQSYERDAIQQLLTMHTGAEIYRAKNSQYFPTAAIGITDINAAFDLNIIENGFTYLYVGTDVNFAGGASRNDGSYSIEITQGAALTSTNPCCASGTCPTLLACP